MGDELLGRGIRSIDVPARHPTSPDIQFAGGGDWNRPQPFVENINLLVGQRTTEGHCACSAVAFVNLNAMRNGADGRFGWSIVIEDHAFGAQRLDLFNQTPRARLAAKHEPPPR